MSIDSSGGLNKDPYIQQSSRTEDAEKINEANRQQENKELEESSIGKADEAKVLSHLEPSNPRLSSPNSELLAQQSSNTNLNQEELTDQKILDELQKYPQFKEFLDAQSLFSQSDVVDHARQVMLNNSNSNMDITALAGKALAGKIGDAAQLDSSLALQEMKSGLKTELLLNNHPSAKILVESLKNDFIAQGKSPEEAEKLAVQKAVEMIQSEFSGDIATANPKIEKAIVNLLATELGGTDEAKNFIINMSSLLNMEEGLVGIFEKMAEIQSTDNTQAINTNTQQNIIKGAQELVDASLAQINKLPLPGDQKAAILGFMEAISAALAEMEAVLAEISIADLQRSREDTQVQLDSIRVRLKGQIQKLRKAAKAKKKGGIFGKLKKAFKILGPILAVIAVVVIVVAIIVLLPAAVILAPLVLILIPILMMTLVMIIVAMAVAESGKMDDMMETFMTAATWILQDLMDLDISDEVVAAILAAVLITFVMVFPLGFIATPVLFLLLPELMVRSGVLGAVAQGLGGKLGMSDKEIMKFEAGLRGIAGLATLAVGLRGSSSFESVSKDDQDLLDEEGRNRHGVRMGKRDEARLGAYARTGQTQTLNQLASTGADALEEQKKEMQKMIAMLTKIIAQLQNLLAALMSGGDPGAVDAVINDIQSIIDGGLPSLVNLKSDQELALQPRVKAIAEGLSASLPSFLPSERKQEEQLKEAMRLQTEMFNNEEEDDYFRAHEIMG